MKLYLILSISLLMSQQAIALSDSCQGEIAQYNECIKYHNKEKCDHDIITSYSINLYLPVNKTLRALNNDKDCLEVADKLKNALLALKPSRERVYRSSAFVPELENLAAGDCYQVPTFLSTSLRKAVTKNFLDDTKSSFFTIDTKSGVKIKNYSNSENEKEVIILPGTWLKTITNKLSSKGNSVEFVEVEEKHCLGAKVTAPEFTATIQIVNASYGMNLNPEFLGNSLLQVSYFCNTKKLCSYLISNKRLVDPAPNQDKDFKVSWNCLKGKTIFGPYSVDIPSPSTGVEFEFGCTKDGMQVLRSLP